jgi:hypothetical protein
VAQDYVEACGSLNKLDRANFRVLGPNLIQFRLNYVKNRKGKERKFRPSQFLIFGPKLCFSIFVMISFSELVF